MKRALWITLIALALLALATIGWIVRRFDRSSRHEPLPPARRERLVGVDEQSNEPRRSAAGWGSSTAYAR